MSLIGPTNRNKLFEGSASASISFIQFASLRVLVLVKTNVRIMDIVHSSRSRYHGRSCHALVVTEAS